jgi:hypothetical protein
MRRARLLAEDLAIELLGAAGVPAIAPVHIYRVAISLRAPAREADIEQDGRLIPTEGRAWIEVRRGQPTARQRFTVAHELAHWALRDEMLRTSTVIRASRAFSSEEVLCNTVAGALLMPAAWMRLSFPEAADQNCEQLDFIRDVARSCAVSLGAATVRLRDLFGWPKLLLHWTHQSGGWSYDAAAGTYPWQQGMVVPCAQAGFFLSEAARNRREVRETVLPLIIHGVERHFPAQVLVRDRSAVALIDIAEISPPHATAA